LGNNTKAAPVVFLGLVLGLGACAPVSTDSWYDSERSSNGPSFFEKSRRNKNVSSAVDGEGRVTVQRGDNYYLIARRNQVSLRALLDTNRARAPYRLMPGDRVQLPRPKSYSVRRGDTLYAISRRHGVDVASLARVNRLSAPYTIQIGQELLLPGGDVRVPVARQQTSKTAQKIAKAPTPRRAGRFLVPVEGRVISNFGPKAGGLHNDGINIAAPEGAPIKAAENGVVVYAGNELRGYGNLLLVRHSDGWVSAYAHTSKFKVAAGEKVKQGQIIAEVGSSGNVDRPQLHFELRKGTRAINPKTLI
jgi:murein DD-endopeptidase MepM/ murein hydrolase activator NlpD